MRRHPNRSPSAARALAWCVAALGFTAAGCTSTKALGDECIFNADCTEPLVCSARRCRAQCGSDRDCPRGEVCAGAGQPGKKVCVAPQSERLCAYNSECAPTSTCASGVCHTVCGADVDCVRPPASNTCNVAARICSEPDRVTEGTPDDGGAPSDAATDTPTTSDVAADAPATDTPPPVDVPPVVDAPVAVDAPADVASMDVVATDVAPVDAPDVVDVPAVDAMDASAVDVVTDAADAAPADVRDASTDAADVRDVAVVDVGDSAVLVDGGMVCVGTPDLQTDLDNCGRCGNRCPRPTTGTGSVTCSAGACRTTCVAPYVACNGLCVDTRTDRDHCGGCGVACDVACNAGVCLNPVELVVNWTGGTLVRLSDDTWRGFGYGNWVSETGAAPPVFPWPGYREVPSALPLVLSGRDLISSYVNRLYRITAAGTLQSLGANDRALGDGTDVNRTHWVDVAGLTAVRDATSTLNGIYNAACAAYGAEGRVTCWGSALGYGYGQPAGAERSSPDPAYPVLRFDDQPLTGVVRVRRGTSFTIALRDNGEVWSWGVNGDGRLGLGYAAATDYAAQARRIASLPSSTSIAVGLEFACALDNTGAVWCWGRNDVGQLGDGTLTNRSVPTRVVRADPAMPSSNVPLTDVVAIATSTAQACAITSTRSLYCWGRNLVGQVGVDLAGDVQRASPVPAPTGLATLRVQSVALADGFGCLLSVAETTPTVIPPRVYCWGYEGNLGYPASGRTRAPTRPVFW